MNYENKIELYKARSIGERISAATDFIKQTWRVWLKCTLIISIPFALILGFSMQYTNSIGFNQILSDKSFSQLSFIPQIATNYIVTIIAYLILNAMSGAILILYRDNRLTPETGWSELSKLIFPLMKKTFIIGLYFGIFAFLAILIFVFFALNHPVVLIAFAIIFFLGFLAIMPALSLTLYPAYFKKDVSAWESIKIAFQLGFSDWGSIFVAILLIWLILGVVSMVTGAPYQVLFLFTKGETNPLSFILASVAAFGSLFLRPISFFYFAFQYFSIEEAEEGTSMHSMIDEFDHL